jgi:hypothetical protein
VELAVSQKSGWRNIAVTRLRTLSFLKNHFLQVKAALLKPPEPAEPSNARFLYGMNVALVVYTTVCLHSVPRQNDKWQEHSYGSFFHCYWDFTLEIHGVLPAVD